MTAYMVLDGDPDKVDVAGYAFGDILAADATGTLTAVTLGTNTEVLTADSTETAGVEWATGGGGSFTIEISGTGFVTTGNISVGNGAFTALGPEVTVGATAGDILELTIDSLLAANTGSDLQLDAATRVSSTDTNWWSSGGAASRFPGGLGSWYVETSRFDSAHAPARYTVQAGDVVSGQVTVQLYGRCNSGTRSVNANASYPLRWWVTNLHSGV